MKIPGSFAAMASLVGVTFLVATPAQGHAEAQQMVCMVRATPQPGRSIVLLVPSSATGEVEAKDYAIRACPPGGVNPVAYREKFCAAAAASASEQDEVTRIYGFTPATLCAWGNAIAPAG